MIEPQVDPQLRTVMDHMIHDDAAHYCRTPHGHDGLSVELKRPHLAPVFIGRRGDLLALLGDPLIEDRK